MVLSKENFDKIYSQVPRACVEVLIDMGKGNYVLSKRLISPCIDMWHIPGGTIFFGESLSDSVHRVVKDELGVDVKIKRVVKVLEYIGGVHDHAIGIVFLCKLEEEMGIDKFRGSYQAEEIKIFNVKDLPLNTIKEHKGLIEELEK